MFCKGRQSRFAKELSFGIWDTMISRRRCHTSDASGFFFVEGTVLLCRAQLNARVKHCFSLSQSSFFAVCAVLGENQTCAPATATFSAVCACQIALVVP